MKKWTAALMACILAGSPAAAFAQDSYTSDADMEEIATYVESDSGTTYNNGATKGTWQKINGGWYFMVNGNPLTNGEYKIDGEYYWFNVDGLMQKGWKLNADQTYSYFRLSGERINNGWLPLNDKWYYFAADGLLQSGPIYWGDNLYYSNSKGVMLTGWIEDPIEMEAKTVYADKSGALCQGWKYLVGKDGAQHWYYFWSKNGDNAQPAYELARDAWIYDKGYSYYVNDQGIWEE